MLRIDSAKTDKYGDICPEGKHRYPIGPEHTCEQVGMELGAFTVTLPQRRTTLVLMTQIYPYTL